MDRFIVDFICPEKFLVVEIDGPIHLSTQPEDQAREAVLASLGLKIVRFSNREVLTDMEAVLNRVKMELQD